LISVFHWSKLHRSVPEIEHKQVVPIPQNQKLIINIKHFSASQSQSRNGLKAQKLGRKIFLLPLQIDHFKPESALPPALEVGSFHHHKQAELIKHQIFSGQSLAVPVIKSGSSLAYIAQNVAYSACFQVYAFVLSLEKFADLVM
jgi:hypothetical protein